MVQITRDKPEAGALQLGPARGPGGNIIIWGIVMAFSSSWVITGADHEYAVFGF